MQLSIRTPPTPSRTPHLKCLTLAVAQWIVRMPPKREIQVRFLTAGPIPAWHCGCATGPYFVAGAYEYLPTWCVGLCATMAPPINAATMRALATCVVAPGLAYAGLHRLCSLHRDCQPPRSGLLPSGRALIMPKVVSNQSDMGLALHRLSDLRRLTALLQFPALAR